MKLTSKPEMGNYAYFRLLSACRFRAEQNLAVLREVKGGHFVLASKRYREINTILGELIDQVKSQKDLFSVYNSTIAPWDVRLSRIDDLVEQLGEGAEEEGPHLRSLYLYFWLPWDRLIEHLGSVLPCSPWWYLRDKAKQMALFVEEMNQILLNTTWPQEYDSLIRVNMGTLSSYLLHGGEQEQKSQLISAKEKLMAIFDRNWQGTETNSSMAFTRLITVIVAVLEGHTLEKAKRSVIIWTNGNAQL